MSITLETLVWRGKIETRVSSPGSEYSVICLCKRKLIENGYTNKYIYVH